MLRIISILFLFASANIAWAAMDIASGIWSLKWHFVNFSVFVLIIYFAVRKQIVLKFQNGHKDFLRDSEKLEEDLQAASEKHQKQKEILENIETEIGQMKDNTKTTLENYVAGKKELYNGRREQLSKELEQRKENIKYRLSERLYSEVVGDVVGKVKKDIVSQSNIKNKVEERLFEKQ